MLRIVIGRLLGAIATVLIVVTFVFVATRLTGDPVSYLLPFEFTDEEEAALREKLGVDKPIYVQYVKFLADLATGDLGESHRWRQPAFEMVLDRLPATVQLGAVAFGISILVSVPLGLLAATHRGTSLDTAVGLMVAVGQAVPNFVLGLLLVLLFAIELRWLPVVGYGLDQHLILPAITLAAFPIASQTRIVRIAVSDTYSQDFVRTARAKGLAGHVILLRHALRASLVPILTIVGLQWHFFVGGSIVVETIFAWPGVGRLMIDAVAARDFAIVQAGTIVLSVLFILINMATDISFVIADPRYRASAGRK